MFCITIANVEKLLDSVVAVVVDVLVYDLSGIDAITTMTT